MGKCLPISFVKTSGKPERWATPQHKPKMMGEGDKELGNSVSTPRNLGQLLNVRRPLGGGAEVRKDEPSSRNSSVRFLPYTCGNRHLPVRILQRVWGPNRSTFQFYLYVFLAKWLLIKCFYLCNIETVGPTSQGCWQSHLAYKHLKILFLFYPVP